MKIKVENKKLEDIKSDLEIIFVINKNFAHTFIKDKDTLEMMNFKGENEEIAYLPEGKKIYVGLNLLEYEYISDAVASAARKAASTNAKNLKIAVCFDDMKMGAKAFVNGFILGLYKFDKYKTKKTERELKNIFISTQAYSDKTIEAKELQSAIDEAMIIAKAVNFTRDIVNSMPDEVTPVRLAEIASQVAKENNLECKIHDEKYIQKNKMNAFYSVAKASAHPPRLIHLSYSSKKPKIKIALVGKGLTYDSGGLSLKPGSSMTTMKSDKSGASAVLGIIKAVSELKLDIELHAIAGAAENMVAGNAYKPDDILVSKSGKTIEVKNTDAEGRLVLADCLAYAQELKPDYIVDIATLTGACVVALGEYTSGIMGHNQELKNAMLLSAKNSGELASALEFNKYLKKLLKSEVADISNISSSRYGGAITAALFLSEFIEEEYKDKWLHLDIAGPAYVEQEWGCNPFGAGGAGVRMVVEWLKNL
ncbi:MAG: leucyl aminopeptidase [Campylobacterota bacterium]|nr:leucyl aminopeptidase [Campylobacterota bacterium]